MDPATMMGIGALAGGVGSLLGGLGGGSKSVDPTTTQAYWINRQDQLDFAKMGVQWRVEDAKAAGLHPLYALGANIPTYSPPAITMGDGGASRSERFGRALEGMGQNLSRAAQAQQTAEQKHVNAAQLEVMNSQVARNYAEQAYFDSAAARNYQEAFQSRPIPMPGLNPNLVHPSAQGGGSGLVTIKPDEVTSYRPGDPSMTAGSHSAMREYNVTPSGLKMRLPYSEEGPGEAMENIPWWAWPAMIQHNRAYYGEDWGQRFFREFVLGQSPKYRQMPPRVLEPRFDTPTVRKYLPKGR